MVFASHRWELESGGGLIGLFHFFLPFLLLLFRGVKKQVLALSLFAALVFIMRMVDVYWLIMPALHQHRIAVSWMDFAALLGIGSLWASCFLARSKVLHCCRSRTGDAICFFLWPASLAPNPRDSLSKDSVGYEKRDASVWGVFAVVAFMAVAALTIHLIWSEW